jgi:periplasmic divalent cation tolerance protein
MDDTIMTMMMKPLIVLTTIGVNSDAHSLGQELVEQRLAACVNVIPGVESIYRWKGVVETGREQILMIKTTEAKVNALREALLGRHPYDVPEFVVLAIADVSEPYQQWLEESLR